MAQPPNIVTLPSIHEMFPDHILTKSGYDCDRGRSKPRSESLSPYTRPLSGPPPRSSHPQYSPPVPSKNIPSSSRSHPMRTANIDGTPMRPGPSTMGPPSSSHHGHPPFGSMVPSHGVISARRADSSHSFDVLRSDPSGLQHLTSSATLPNRGLQGVGNGAHSGIASGSTQVFRVSVPSASGLSADLLSSSVFRQDLPASASPMRSSDSARSRKLSSGPPYPAIISFPVSGSTHRTGVSDADYSREDTGNASDDDSPSEGNSGKKHICPTCLKRFNRPSSLRIHVNTHTGATPFRCPWPNCGREFNVNSNMRRHYRNHTTPGFSRTQPTENRRRRRRTVPSPATSAAPMHGAPTMQRPRGDSFVASPPISCFSISEDSGDDVSDSMDGDIYSKQEADEEDQLLQYESQDSPAAYRTSSLIQSISHVAVGSERSKSSRETEPPSRHRQYSQSNIRSITPGSSFHSSSPSASPSPSPSPSAESAYNASSPYLRSVADTRVSTALRPAFHPRRMSSGQLPRDERMSDTW